MREQVIDDLEAWVPGIHIHAGDVAHEVEGLAVAEEEARVPYECRLDDDRELVAIELASFDSGGVPLHESRDGAAGLELFQVGDGGGIGHGSLGFSAWVRA